MKSFIGLLLAGAGGLATLWGGYHVLTGQANAHVPLTTDLSVSALTVGLAGVAVFTIGLVWSRD